MMTKPKPDPDRPGVFLPSRRSSKRRLSRSLVDIDLGEFSDNYMAESSIGEDAVQFIALPDLFSKLTWIT